VLGWRRRWTASFAVAGEPDRGGLVPPERLDASYRNLDRLIGWVTNADQKGLIALTLEGILIAGLVASGGTIAAAIERSPEFLVKWALIALLVAFGWCAGMFSLTPREKEEGKRSPFFFGTIQAMGLDDFAALMRGMGPAEIEWELIRQTHVNAGIVARKFMEVKKALRWLFAQIPLVLLIALVVGWVTYTVPAAGTTPQPAPTPVATNTGGSAPPTEAKDG
jgi:hypothetical protein